MRDQNADYREHETSFLVEAFHLCLILLQRLWLVIACQKSHVQYQSESHLISVMSGEGGRAGGGLACEKGQDT